MTIDEALEFIEKRNGIFIRYKTIYIEKMNIFLFKLLKQNRILNFL